MDDFRPLFLVARMAITLWVHGGRVKYICLQFTLAENADTELVFSTWWR